MRKFTPVITCEHAGNTIPEPYAHLFETAYDEIQSHLGWDPGAREIGAFLAQHLGAPFYKCEATRLLVEPNRSLHSESLFSKFVQSLSPAERDEVTGLISGEGPASRDERITRVIQLMSELGSLEYARDLAVSFARLAFAEVPKAFAGAHSQADVDYVAALVLYLCGAAKLQTTESSAQVAQTIDLPGVSQPFGR